MKSLFCIFLMFFCLSTYAQNKVVRRKGTISQTEVSASKKTTTTQSKNNFKKPQISKVKSSDNQINKIGLFSDGYAMIRRNKKCGYIDKTGKEIIPCIFDFADDFQDGVAFVEKG